MTDAFVARFSPWRRGAGVLLAAGFVALGLWEAGAFGGDGPHAPVVGYPCAALFAVFGAIGVRRLAMTGAALRVDAEGIWLWRGGGGVTVPWAAIRAVDIRVIHSQRFVCLWTDDPARYRPRGWLGRTNDGLGFGDVVLGVQATDRRFAELVASIERFGGVAMAGGASDAIGDEGNTR